MLIAKEKRKENIAEYLLYMWQVEDTIRACNFSIDAIEERIINHFNGSEKVRQEIKDWYVNLILMMHEEKIRKSGHLKFLNELVDGLFALHQKIIEGKRDQKYLEQYYWAVPNIRDFEKKLNGQARNEIETCLSALYALLLLRLQKKNVSQETLEAMQTFSNLLVQLSAAYKQTSLEKAAP